MPDGRSAFAARLRNLTRTAGVSPDVAAEVLREVAGELVPDVDTDERLRREVEFWADLLRAERHTVTPDLMISTQGAARLLACSAGTLDNKRSNGDGPPEHGKLGGRVVYSLRALLAWRRSKFTNVHDRCA